MSPTPDPPLHQPPAEEVARPWFRSKWFNLGLGLIVTSACLGYAMVVMADGRPVGIVFREIGAAFSQADYSTLLPMAGLLFLFYWLKAWRWRMLLAPLGRFGTSRLFPPTLIGFAFNNVLPAHLGEFVRVFVFARQSGLPKSAVLATIAVERVFDVVAILVFLGSGLLFLPDLDPSVSRSAMVFAVAAAGAVLVAAAYLLWPVRFVTAFEWGLRRIPLLPHGLQKKLCDLLETGATGLASLKSGPLLLGILVTSLLQWAFNGALIYLSLTAFGIRLSPLVACVILGVVAIGVTVPSSPGYFGVVQLCFLIVLRLFVSKEQEPTVMAASIYYHMTQWVPVTALGMLYFVRSGLHVADIEEEVEHPQPEPPALS
jgi:glycosyltransferase 2 family protein